MGSGEKVAVFIFGGPGNPAPVTGWQGMTGIKALCPLLERGYRLVTVTRRRNMPEGHSIADMAGDYAQMTKAECGGRVGLVVGGSYGGMIGLYLAADYPDYFNHIAIVVAACEVHDPEGIDQQFAKALADGRLFAGGAIMSKTLFPDAGFAFLARLISGFFVRLRSGKPHEYLANDVMVETEAEAAFNAREALPRIKVPVLLIGGDILDYIGRA